MPKPHAQAILDGISTTAGMHSGIAPRLLPANQMAFAINITSRNGLPRTRPVWRKVPLSYPDGTTQTNATAALFQCGSFYQAVGRGENCLIASIGGRLFRYLVGTTNVVQDVSISGDLNASNNPNCWMWQGEDFLIVQNGRANPLLFDGSSTRRSRGFGGNELPPGCMGVYVQGRNWMTLPNRQAFIAGDLVYSKGFTGSYGGRDSILGTEENSFIQGGGAFAIPITAGLINAMSSVAIADTSLGQGPLQVMTTTAVYSVQTPINREDWAATQYPLMTIGMPNYGSISQWATVTVNGDLWYRSLDGVRSYQIARRDFNTWVNTPLSVEIEKILDLDSPILLEKSSGVLFDNRVLLTCSPYYVADRGTAHRGLVALDFNNISNLTTRTPPVWDGLWTGIPVLQIIKGVFNGVERCFAFALDCDDKIVLYELLNDGQGMFDWDGSASVPIKSRIETKALSWAGARADGILKKLLCGDLYLDKLAGPGAGTVTCEFQYRSDEDPVWQDWHSFDLCAPMQDCSLNGCPEFQNVREQYRTFLRLPDPRDTCSQITKRMLRTGYEFQIGMNITGWFQLNRFHAWALAMGDSVVTVCPTSENCVLLKGCDEPWFDYEVTPCPDDTGGDKPDDVGACCIDGVCSVTTRALCAAGGGTFQGKGTTCTAGLCDETPAVPANPVWPVPEPYACEGRSIWGVIEVEDPGRGGSAFVGINPGATDPVTYCSTFGAPGCLNAWSAEVWSQFLAAGISYSSARLIWVDWHTTGNGFMGTQVFPDQAGFYAPVIDLDTKIAVELCPPI